MINEPGIDYTPRPEPPKAEDKAAVQKTPPTITLEERSIPARPLAARVAIYLLLFVAFTRISEAMSTSGLSAGVVVVRTLSGFTLLLIVVGLIGMRRWGLWLAVTFSYWNVISLIVVGVYRIVQMNEVIGERLDRETLIASEILRMGLGIAIYSALGTWLFWNRGRFLPSMRGWNARGNVSALVMVGLLVLYTGTRISTTRHDLRLEQAQLHESQSWMDNTCSLSIMKFL